MQILTIDVGTGTQDIFLYDSRFDLENGFKLVVPSPTMIVHRHLRDATRAGDAVLLTGVTMGGGPSQWAAEDHIRAGLKVFATPDAARSFNDELEVVESMGIQVISEDEAEKAVFASGTRLRKGRRPEIYYLFGWTEAGRYLFIVLLEIGKHYARVITAGDMSQREKRWYRS